jgi:phage tail P2-like protein
VADHLLPPNATADEKAIASALSRLSDVPVPIRELWNPDTCPAELLPWLAWALSVDVWNTAWPEAKKRQVIKAAIVVHRHKGTPYAVEEAFRAVNIRATVKEWFEYGGDPHKFKLAVDVVDEGLSATTYAIIEEIAAKTKNVRSHLDGLDVYLSGDASVQASMHSQVGTSMDVYPWIPEDQDVEASTQFSAGIAVYTIIDIEYQGAGA